METPAAGPPPSSPCLNTLKTSARAPGKVPSVNPTQTHPGRSRPGGQAFLPGFGTAARVPRPWPKPTRRDAERRARKPWQAGGKSQARCKMAALGRAAPAPPPPRCRELSLLEKLFPKTPRKALGEPESKQRTSPQGISRDFSPPWWQYPPPDLAQPQLSSA